MTLFSYKNKVEGQGSITAKTEYETKLKFKKSTVYLHVVKNESYFFS